MEHEFYSLDEAARELHCEINDLLKWGASGRIDLCIYYEGEDLSPENELVELLEPEKFFFNPSSKYVKKFLTISKEDVMRVYQEHNGLLRANRVVDCIMIIEWRRKIPEPYPMTVKALYLTNATIDCLRDEVKGRISADSVAQVQDSGSLRIAVSQAEEVDTEPVESVPTGKVIVGWKGIANHLEVSESTAKRYSRGAKWPTPGPAGRPTTTTDELDKWRLPARNKKKKRGA